MKGSFKTALIAAIVSAIVSAGAAVATTQTFVLGASNTPDAPTGVVAQNVDDLGGLNAPMLKLTNSSSGGSATPLALNAGVGRPPFTVNVKTKVPNMNADFLDGFDSAYFLPKTGTAANSSKLGGQPPSYYLPATAKAADSDKLDGLDSTAFAQASIQSARRSISTGSDFVTVLSESGLGDVLAACESSGSAEVAVYNPSGSGHNIEVYGPNTYSIVGPGLFVGFGGWEGIRTIQFGRTQLIGLSVVVHVASVTVGVHEGNPCRIEAQAVKQP
jgi:hypothetical protein